MLCYLKVAFLIQVKLLRNRQQKYCLSKAWQFLIVLKSRMGRDFLIIGDSNVQRFYTRMGLTAQSLDFVRARNMEEAKESFPHAKSTYKFIVLAFLTNLIVTAGEEGANPTERLTAIESLFNEVIPAIGLVNRIAKWLLYHLAFTL